MLLVPRKLLAWPTPTTDSREPHRQRHRQREVIMPTLTETGIRARRCQEASRGGFAHQWIRDAAVARPHPNPSTNVVDSVNAFYGVARAA